MPNPRRPRVPLTQDTGPFESEPFDSGPPPGGPGLEDIRTGKPLDLEDIVTPGAPPPAPPPVDPPPPPPTPRPGPAPSGPPDMLVPGAAPFAEGGADTPLGIPGTFALPGSEGALPFRSSSFFQNREQGPLRAGPGILTESQLPFATGGEMSDEELADLIAQALGGGGY